MFMHFLLSPAAPQLSLLWEAGEDMCDQNLKLQMVGSVMGKSNKHLDSVNTSGTAQMRP